MKRLFTLTMCALCLMMGMNAQTAKKILDLQKNNTSYTEGFTQTKVMPKLKKEVKKSGSLTWNAPGSLKLTYTDPAGDYIEIAPNVFNVCQEGKVQKLPAKDSKSKMSVLRQTLILAFKGDVEAVAALNEAQAAYEEKGGVYTCTLTTNQGKHGVQSLVLVYDKKGRLSSLTITENNGNYVTYNVK